VYTLHGRNPTRWDSWRWTIRGVADFGSLTVVETISNNPRTSFAPEGAVKILNALQEHILCFDRDMNIIWANSAILDTFERSLENIRRERCWSIWAERQTPCEDCPVIRAMETGSFQTIEKTSADGRCWLIKGYPLRDDRGKVIGGFETTLDISERKKAEKHLQLAFDILNRSPAVGFLWKNTEGWPVVFVTPNVTKLFGYSADEFVSGKISYEQVVYPEDLPRVMDEVTTNSSDRERQEFEHQPYRIVSKNGEVRWILDRTTIDRDKEGAILFYKGIVVDITDRIKTDRVLKDNEEKYRHLFHHSNDAIFIHDVQGNILEVNRRVLDQFGYTRNELLSLTVQDLHPAEVLEKAHWAFKTILEKGFVNFETTFKRKNGACFIADVSSSLFNLNETQVIQGIVRDITSRRKAAKERKRLETQLQQAQKMEAIGTLAGGIAHDFNNLLMGIQGRASLMAIDLEPSNPHGEHIHAVEEYIRSAADLTKQLLDFARGGKYKVRALDINELLSNSAAMFGRTRKEIAVHTSFQHPALVVEVDRSQIEQTLLNIFVNAWQAMPGGGKLSLETKSVELDAAYCRPHNATPGRYVRISITDTGIGMDDSTLRRVFDPFFSTKKKGRGIGLGLASAYGIVKNHGGLITVYSEVGLGTTFNIYLPVSDKEPRQDISAKDDLTTGSETILLVDDEEMIIEVAAAMLEKLGYRVLVCRSGPEAIDKMQSEGHRIDLVLLDLIMPGMDGGKTFDRIREIRPGMPVMLSSGYAIEGQAADIIMRGCNGFIQKPFDISELSLKVRNILDQTTARSSS